MNAPTQNPSNGLDTVEFHGNSLIIFEQGGEHYIACKPIAEAMGLQWRAQYHRIKRNPVLNEGVSLMDIPSAGGEQKTVTLPLKLLNGWLFGIDARRVKPEIRERILMYQRDCFDALWRHFNPAQTLSPAPTSALPEPEPQRTLPRELEDAIDRRAFACAHLAYERYRRIMAERAREGRLTLAEVAGFEPSCDLTALKFLAEHIDALHLVAARAMEAVRKTERLEGAELVRGRQ